MTTDDIESMEKAHAFLVIARDSFDKAGVGVERLIDLIDDTIRAARQKVEPPDPWKEARDLIDDILDGGVPSRSSAIALAKQARKMLAQIDGVDDEFE